MLDQFSDYNGCYPHLAYHLYRCFIPNSLGTLFSQKVANEVQLLAPIKYCLLPNG